MHPQFVFDLTSKWFFVVIAQLLKIGFLPAQQLNQLLLAQFL